MSDNSTNSTQTEQVPDNSKNNAGSKAALWQMMKPAVVLTVILTIVSALLIIASRQFVVDPTILSDDMKALCIELMGADEYSVAADLSAYGLSDGSIPSGFKRLIVGKKGGLAIETLGSGYAKDGVDALVAFDKDGNITGVAVVTLEETPGFGDRIKNDGFLQSFAGMNAADTDRARIAAKPTNPGEVTGVSGATRSSRGMANAVTAALETYRAMVLS
jgi:electron transport complex protein RnfG